MKYVLWAFLLLALLSVTEHSDAQTGGYTLDNAPWSDESYEVCPVENENGFRPVIFEPEIETWSYTPLDLHPTTRLTLSDKGIKEVVVRSKQPPRTSYFLKEQKIGYINKEGTWVNENGNPLTRLADFKIISGKKEKPSASVLSETFVYRANPSLEHKAAMEKIHYEAPCSFFALNHHDKLKSEVSYDFGSNNPYQCDENLGLKRSQNLNYTSSTYRPIVNMPDGTSYFVKHQTGEIEVYPWYGVELLFDQNGIPLCKWSDLGSITGYELIHPNE